VYLELIEAVGEGGKLGSELFPVFSELIDPLREEGKEGMEKVFPVFMELTEETGEPGRGG
jgi:hypothetical protein